MGTESRFHGVDREWGLGYFFKKCEGEKTEWFYAYAVGLKEVFFYDQGDPHRFVNRGTRVGG